MQPRLSLKLTERLMAAAATSIRLADGHLAIFSPLLRRSPSPGGNVGD